MNAGRSSYRWLAACLLVSSLAAKDIEVLVVTDRIKEVAFEMPTADKPCYFVLLGGEQRALGQSTAGERMPVWSEVQSLLLRELAKQHFRLTEVGGPRPRLALLCTWGEANRVTDEFEETDPESGESSPIYVDYNRDELIRLAGAQSQRRHGLSMAAADHLNTILSEDRLYIMVAALDAEALQRREKRLVWRTWISVPQPRNSLPQAMEQMIVDAAPHFGVETEASIVINDRVRRAEVKIGDATPVEPAAEPAAKP